MLKSIIPVAILVFSVISNAHGWSPVPGKLTTRWTADVSPQNVLPEYPRPQFVRKQWTNLNGLWNYAITEHTANRPNDWDGEILVPFCIESTLSGVGKHVSPQQDLWYQREFSLPDKPSGRLLLHFGAIDWEATVWINGEQAGAHQGGYDPFSLDITDLVSPGSNEIVIRVWDPTDTGHQPRGKQVQKPHGIWYTPVTGIWQTAWLEPVPEFFIHSLRIRPDLRDSSLLVTAHANIEGQIRVQVLDNGQIVGKASGQTGQPLAIPISAAKLWSPDMPHLYDLAISLHAHGEKVDSVTSYCGMREISVKKDDHGINRIFLNGAPLFQYGPLDQGWWPDGLYTAPTDEALRYDVEVTKRLGFNMTRKHVKVEPARWYYWCDKLGLLVWQDMPSGDAHPEWVRDVDQRGPELRRSVESAQQFRTELTELVNDFINHPSIVVWVLYNERWGQSDTAEGVAWLRRLDPSRLINSASGGNFLGVGDILDVHNYPDPVMPGINPLMAVVCGEFGGLGLPVEGHTWLDKGNWGYRSFENKKDLTTAYLEKIELLKPMIEEGLAAAVYTQITDVEIEVNGLLTYDRSITKMDETLINNTNRSLYESAKQED